MWILSILMILIFLEGGGPKTTLSPLLFPHLYISRLASPEHSRKSAAAPGVQTWKSLFFWFLIVFFDGFWMIFDDFQMFKRNWKVFYQNTRGAAPIAARAKRALRSAPFLKFVSSDQQLTLETVEVFKRVHKRIKVFKRVTGWSKVFKRV